MELLLWAVLAYLIGSIPSGVIVAAVMGATDPRSAGSGNIGATNVGRTLGKKAGIVTLLGDVLKGFAPTVFALWYLQEPQAVAVVGMATFCGHLFPLYLKFKGGKGIATGAGVFLAVAPSVLVAALVVFALVFWKWRFVGLSSVMASVSLPIFTFFYGLDQPVVMLALAVAVLAIWKHRSNISRIMAGTEPRWGDKVSDEERGK